MKRRSLSAWLCSVAAGHASVVAALPASSSACNIADAHYSALRDSGASLRFHRSGFAGWPSDLSLQLSVGGADYWFLFDGGSSDETQLISTTDQNRPAFAPPSPDGGVRPLGSMPYYAFAADLTTIEGLPRGTMRAPAYIFVPGLGDALWYMARPRASLGVTMFRLDRCETQSR